MFCPKCGNNCGDNRFCGRCGAQVQMATEQKPQQIAWVAGMACPHCGGTKLEGNNCAFCGAQLIADVPQRKDEDWDSYEIPYRSFAVGMGTSLILNRDEMIIETKTFLSKDQTRIPYAHINEAEYTRTAEYTGKITFRWGWGNTDSLILYNEDKCFFYYQVFFIIKLLSPPGTQFKINCPSIDGEQMERFGKSVDLNGLFEKYAPCRELAAIELGAKCMISPEEARSFVHAFFDMRLKESYEADRRLAARDYNRMVQDRHRHFEEREKERERRRAQRNRYR
jgi:DNA-directed RNA polymerase subunit RPC12/RpoP